MRFRVFQFQDFILCGLIDDCYDTSHTQNYDGSLVCFFFTLEEMGAVHINNYALQRLIPAWNYVIEIFLQRQTD